MNSSKVLKIVDIVAVISTEIARQGSTFLSRKPTTMAFKREKVEAVHMGALVNLGRPPVF